MSAIEFYTAAKEKRPVRLPEASRRWAWESQHGKYGDEAMQTPAVEMNDIPGFAEMEQYDQQDLGLRRIAERAPIRLCPHEKIAGAATLGEGIRHHIPFCLNGQRVHGSVSHHTPNFRRALTEGMESYERSVQQRLQDPALTAKQKRVLRGLQNVIDSMRIWHGRYLEATKDAAPEIHALLQQVPFKPARSFHEAVQSLWFVFAFMRLCGNWPGIGRMDWLLGDYLKADLADGKITLDEAREILASLFVKGCEWIQSDTPRGSGDAQHYQNVVLAGIDEAGNEVTNEVTYLVLDIVEELAISDFPITVRINENTPEKLLLRIGEVVRHGGGVVAVYNEPLILKALEQAGYDPVMARRFANDGCWEVQLPGETNFGYLPFDGAPAFGSTEEIYQAFLGKLREYLEKAYRGAVGDFYYEDRVEGWSTRGNDHCSVVTLFTDGCIENAKDYFDFGPHYTVRSPHIGGAPDVGNSLCAIEKMVFEEKKMSMEAMLDALRNNWEGYELERQYVRSRFTYYGNDSDEADGYTVRVLNDFADLVTRVKNDTPVLFVPGVSTFGRQIDWAPQRQATAFGAKRGEILSGNGSPTPGTDLSGATAIIRSFCKADMSRQTTGAALDIKLFPDTVKGENGREAIAALIRGFTLLGGFFMQIDVLDAEALKAAQEHPEEYKTLSVRVSGWNARFVTLNEQWQKMIIERTAQGL